MVSDPRAKGRDGENLSKRIKKIQRFYLLLPYFCGILAFYVIKHTVVITNGKV